MGSINAQTFAIKVSEKVRKGEKVVLGKIAKEVGYSQSMSRKPNKITGTKTYQTAIALEQKPLLEDLQLQINRMKQALLNKDMNDEETKVLLYGIDTLVKNYQLLSGGATERQVFVLPSEVMGRNAIVSSDSKQLPDNGSTKPQKGNE